MGLLDFGEPKEKRTQLYFRDDHKFIFRSMEVEDTFLVEKKDDNIIRGWPLFYKNQFPFSGYKGMKPDIVTLGYSRDVKLDPFGIVKDLDEVPQNKPGIKPAGKPMSIVLSWLVAIGHARRLKVMGKRANQSTYDKVIIFLGAGFMMEFIIILIKVAQHYGK